MSLARVDDFVHVAERSGGDDGPEDFFLHHLHVVVGIHEDGGLDEVALVAFAGTTDGGFGAFLDARFEIAADAIELLFGNERAEIAFGVESWTDADFRGGLGDAVDDLVENFLFDEEARAGAAALALIEEDGHGGAGDGGFEIGVVHDDVGRLAAEFERDFLQVAGRGVDDELADFGGAGEGDFIDVHVCGERGAGSFAVAGNDVDDAIREAGFLHQFAETQCRERCLLGWLEHDATARGEGGAEFPGGHQQREIPRE